MYFYILGYLGRDLERLRAHRERLTAGAYRGPLPTDAWWLLEAFTALSVISSLSALRLGKVRAGKADEGTVRALHEFGELRRPEEQAEGQLNSLSTLCGYLLRQAGLEG